MNEPLEPYKDENALLSISDEETEILVPKRKPIGWNYQNAINPPTEIQTKKVNGELVTSKSAPTCPRPSSTDDIEILEVLELVPNPRPKPKFPPSSTKREIKSIIRNSTQSSISTFLAPVVSAPLKKEKDDENTTSRVPSTSHKPRLWLKKRKSPPPTPPPAREAKATDSKSSEVRVKDEEKDKAVKEVRVKNEEKDKAVKEDRDKNEEKDKAVKEDRDKNEEKDKAVKEVRVKNEEKDKAVEEEPKSPAVEASSSNSTPSEEPKEVEITSEYSRTTLENFIDRWKSLQTFTRDEEKIKDKIWKNYLACHSTYTHSRRFINDLQKATENLIKLENIYVYISKLIDCLKRYKDTPYIEKEEDPDEWLRKKRLQEGKSGETKEGGEEEGESKELSEEDTKKKKKIARVEKEMMKISKKIQKLEEAEVDLDDEVNSSYLVLDRLKSSFVKLDEYYCKLVGCSTSTGRPVEKKFKYKGSRYPEINKRITAWVNKNRCFPEYMDVLNLVKSITKRDNLPLRPETLRVQAQEIFRDVGGILKERRERDDLFGIYAYASCDDATMSLDPAQDNPYLCQQLRDNEKEARQNLDDVFQRFVDKEAEAKDKKDGSDESGRWSDAKGDMSLRTETDQQNLETSQENKTPPEEDNDVEVNEIEEVIESSLDGEEGDQEGADDDDDDYDDDLTLPDLMTEEEIEEAARKNDEAGKEGCSLLQKVSETESFSNGFDDSDDDIQEIREILAAPPPEEEEDEEDYDEEDEIKSENFSEEELEIDPYPSVPFPEEYGFGAAVDLDEDSIPEVTCFKRRYDEDEEEYPVLPTKRMRPTSLLDVPEVVEID